MRDKNLLIRNGINVEKGVNYFNQFELYENGLKDFINTYNQRVDSLKNVINNNDIPGYFTEIHNICDDSDYLGFDNLHNISKTLEEKASVSDFAYINANNNTLITELARVYASIQMYFGLTDGQNISGITTVQPTAPVAQDLPVKEDNQVSVQNQVQVQSQPQVQVTPSVQSQQPVQVQSQTQVNPNIQSQPQIPVMNGSADNFSKIASNVVNNDNNGGVSIRPVINVKRVKDNLLIIDDSALIVNFVKRIFSDDYEVLSAKDGEQGIKLLDNEEVRNNLKLCFLDLNMPKVDGYAVLEHCKVNNYFSQIPIIVESGIEDTMSLDRVNAYPVMGILIKPFKENDARRMIEKGNNIFY